MAAFSCLHDAIMHGFLSIGGTMTTPPKPPSLSTKPKKRLLSTLLVVWGCTFAIAVFGLFGLALFAWMAMLMGMVGYMPRAEDIAELTVIVLGAAFAIASVVTLVVAIPMWIFQKPDTPEPKPVPKPQASWVELAKRDDAQESIAEPGDDAAPAVLLPSYGLFWLLAAMLLAGAWLGNAEVLYHVWDVGRFAPHLALLCLVAGSAQLAWRYARHRACLARTGWRLRGVLAVVAAVLVTVAYQVPDREALLECWGDAVEGLVEAQNLGGFERYLARHPVCRGDELSYAVDRLGKVSFRDYRMPSRQRYTDFLRVLIDHDADLSETFWQNAMDNNVMRAAILEALSQGGGERQAFSGGGLERWLMENTRSENEALIQPLFDAGLRLDRGDWPAAAAMLRHSALIQDKPAWNIYNRFAAAGLVEKPTVKRLLEAIQRKDPSLVAGFTQADWMALPDGESFCKYSLLALAMLYTEDAALRESFLRQAGVSADELLARTVLPERCQLGKHLGPRRVLASFDGKPDAESGRAQCAELMQALIYQEEERSKAEPGAAQ